MKNANSVARNLLAVSLLLTTLAACKEDKTPQAVADGAAPATPGSTSPVASASAPAEPVASASASAVASAAPAASGSASAPKADCPKGSTGEGSFTKPCEAKGGARLMDVAWTGKTDEKGPHFRVTNKAAKPILYGKVNVYFYDKAGKQLEVKSDGKTRPYQSCGGNIFGGIMKPAEKAVVMFSCVKKDHVPEGATAIEAEMQMVGFADSTEKKSDLFWENKDIAPEARKKGGVK